MTALPVTPGFRCVLPTLPETFRCLPLSCSLTRAACAQRHERAMNGGRVAGARISDARLMSSACVGCEVGAAHARGETPDVTIASVFARAKEERMPRPTMITHEGVEKPLGVWAREAGLDTQTLRDRIKSGWDLPRALGTPVLTHSEAGAMRKAAPKRGKASMRSVEIDALVEPAQVGEVLDAALSAAGVAPKPKRVKKSAESKAWASVSEKPDADVFAPIERVTVLASPQHAVDVLARLGFAVEDAGLVPAGHLILIRPAVSA